MTEFSTNNDINNKSHLSQPLQNSPRHFQHPTHFNHNQQKQHQNSPQHIANINKHLTHALKQNFNNKNNQQTLPLNSSANINNKNVTLTSTASAGTTATNSPTSAIHSPLHTYRNPLNSPNNSPFAYAYYDNNIDQQQQQQQQQHPQQQQTQQQQQQQHTKIASATQSQQLQLLQQHLRSTKLPILTQTHYQQHLNDLLLQQQHLQQQQQQLLNAKDADDELSEESLKQNVAIVLNNLDRYNNALRSIILNEEVSNSSSVFLDDSFLIGSSGNNNFLLNSGTTMAAPATPESDYNSNATTPGSRSNMLPHDSNMLTQQHQQQHLVGFATTATACGGGVGNNILNNGIGGFCSLGNNVASNNLNCSLASSHDFTHDNSDYQWFLDYGYRDGCSGMQRSVLSSLSASYNGIGDLIYYEDIAKNLDANLAEVDMESFRAEDMHSLLYLPSYCKGIGGNSRLQQSLMLQQNMLPQITQQGHLISQTSTTSTNELIDNSICKSELLFSPVKESHISVDSLDMDAYPEDGDIILTCQANKDNYTIAFEGSVLYSDDSFYAEPNDIALKNKQNCINLHNNLDDIVKRKSLDVSMSRSEQQFTPRNKLQKSSTTQLQRYPSGNNNTSDVIAPQRQIFNCAVRKSNSLPNLRDKKEFMTNYCRPQQLNVSQAVSTSTVESCKTKNLLPMCQMPISCNSTSVSISDCLTARCQQPQHQHHHHQHQQHQQQQQQQLQQRHKHRCCCSSAGNSHNSCTSATAPQQQQKHAHISGSTSSGNSNPPAFNLVKLFIKQKSSNCSIDDQASAHTCMDVSSGCWPSSDAAGSSSSSSLEQRLRKKSMNDSGKGSALSRHDEEDMRAGDDSAFLNNKTADEHSTPKKYTRTRHDNTYYDEEDPNSSSAGSATVTNSPAHRRRSVPLRNPTLCQLVTNHNIGTSMGSMQSSEASRSNSEQITQVYLSSGTANSGANTLERKKSGRINDNSRPTSTASSSEMITRSMQTSCGSLSTRSSLSDRFRCIPPSFLEKLNNLGEERQAPIYVIYPNYALPDLGFVKTHASKDMIFSPFNYKATIGNDNGSNDAINSMKKRFSLSDNENEILKTMDYKHVIDWQSLATLLPAEYRRRLKHIPQVSNILHELDSELSQRPLFCMTPPVRRNRPHICECAQYFQNQQTQLQTGEEAGGSSSSGSSQQPSSGYRGSSTLLTDSELDNTDPLKQMYVYQYEQQRMDSGAETSPVGRKVPPQPMPRGILRKTSSQPRTKRNSMIEEQHTKLSKLEKRRSLQEPPYQQGVGSSEELYEVFEEESTDLYAMPQPRKERLSRKDLDARARAESFLSALPRSELRYYAEIASILESSEQQVEYDAAALKKEVSRALSQQKKVSFNDLTEEEENQVLQQRLLQPDTRHQRFTTPPNSPNISMAGGGLRMHGGHTVPRRNLHAEKPTTLDEKERRKQESNHFKRLQIQWELMSKDSTMLKDLANAQQTKSGGSTPTSATAQKSRIPRPVSYPAGKITTQEHNGKTTRSPSRIVPPKRYSMTSSPVTPGGVTSPSTPTGVTTTTPRARTPNSRTSVTAPNTPKRRVQSPRTVSRVR